MARQLTSTAPGGVPTGARMGGDLVEIWAALTVASLVSVLVSWSLWLSFSPLPGDEDASRLATALAPGFQVVEVERHDALPGAGLEDRGGLGERLWSMGVGHWDWEQDSITLLLRSAKSSPYEVIASCRHLSRSQWRCRAADGAVEGRDGKFHVRLFATTLDDVSTVPDGLALTMTRDAPAWYRQWLVLGAIIGGVVGFLMVRSLGRVLASRPGRVRARSWALFVSGLAFLVPATLINVYCELGYAGQPPYALEPVVWIGFLVPGPRQFAMVGATCVVVALWIAGAAKSVEVPEAP